MRATVGKVGALALAAILAAGCGVASVRARAAARMDPVAMRPDEVRWGPAPAWLPPGAAMAVLEGDPEKEGLFAIRLRLPDGYRIAPHQHAKNERMTVLSGTVHVGIGDRFDPAEAEAFPAGSYGFWPPGTRHYFWTEGPTVLQVYSNGPWEADEVAAGVDSW